MKSSIKILSVALAVVMFFVTTVVWISAASDDPTFVVGSAQGAVGDVVSVPLSLKNNPGITALKVSIAYPVDSFELLSVEDAGLFESAVSTSSFTKNPVTVSWFAADSGNKKDNGELCILKFRIKDDAKSGEITVSYDEEDVFDNTFTNVSFKTENGSITVGCSHSTEAATESSELPVDVPSFVLSSAKGVEGKEVAVTLSVLNNPGITSLSVDIAYSGKDLQLQAIEDAGLFESAVSTSSYEKDPVTISWFASDSGNKENSGVLATLVFKIKENAETSEITLSYDEDNVFDNTFTNVAFHTIDGTITAEQAAKELLGDADCDESISIFDATAIQRFLAEIPVPNFSEKAADADEDGSVSIFDATSIQRWLADIPTNPNIGKPMT